MASPGRAAAPSRHGFGVHRFAPALAGFALLAIFAAFQADRAAALETGYLAFWSVAVLLPVAVLLRGRPWETAMAPLVAVLAVWVLPAGAARAAALGAWLVAASAAGLVVTAAGWARWNAGERTAAGVAAALGAQMLLQAERLLAPSPADLVALVALPAVAGLALVRLAGHRGLGPALVAASAVLALGPGWTVGSTAALVAVTVGAEIAAGRRTRVTLWVLLVGGALLALGAVAATRLTLVAVLAGCVIACDRPAAEGGRRGPPAAGMLVLAFLAVAAARWAAVRGDGEALAALRWLPVLVPSSLWLLLPRSRRDGGTASRRRRRLLAAAGLAVAAAAALGAPGAVALAAPVAALALLGDDLPVGAAGFQRLWSAALLAVTALFAGYPWLRREPLAASLGVWELDFSGASPSPGAAAVLLVTAAVLGLLVRLERPVVALILVALFGTWLVVRPVEPPGRWRDLTAGSPGAFPAALTADRPRLALDLEPAAGGVTSGGAASGEVPPGRIALVTYLSNGATLAPGQVVATVRRAGSGEAQTESWPLRAGVETGEWAVRRPDVAAALPAGGAEGTPEHWLTWVAQPARPGGAPFFGQRYRTVLRLSGDWPTGRIEIERSAELPDQVGLTVHRMQVTR